MLQIYLCHEIELNLQHVHGIKEKGRCHEYARDGARSMDSQNPYKMWFDLEDRWAQG
jgi:hypothetical protein